MKPEREKEIRARLAAFKHWTYLSDNPSGYLESHGPDMEELLEEVYRLRVENQSIKIDRANLESADDRYEFLYSITHEQIEDLQNKLNLAVRVLEHLAEDTEDEYLRGVLAKCSQFLDLSRISHIESLQEYRSTINK